MVMVQVALVQILSEPYILAMHLFICFLVTDFVRKSCSGLLLYCVSVGVLHDSVLKCNPGVLKLHWSVLG